MSQFDFGAIDPNVKTGTQLAADLNSWRDAVHSSHAGAARPAYVRAGMLWVDTSGAPAVNVLYMFDGTNDIEVMRFNSTTHAATPSALSVPQTAPTGAAVMPSGTTAQRPGAPVAGYTRWNTTLGMLERWDGTAWAGVSAAGAGANAIINGDMRIAQRAQTFPTPLNGTYSLDRWLVINATAHPVTYAQAAAVPSAAQAGRHLEWALSTFATAAIAAIASGHYIGVQQRIEGNQWAHLAERPCVLSFWASASVAGTYSVSIVGATTSLPSFVAPFNVGVGGWQRIVIQIPASPLAGFSYGNGLGAMLTFCFAGGSDFHMAPTGGWQASATANPKCVPTQANPFSVIGNAVTITGVDLRPGTEAPVVFESRSIAEELALCQRYYQAINFPGSANPWPRVLAAVAESRSYSAPLRTVMRAAPTLTVTADVAPAIATATFDALHANWAAVPANNAITLNSIIANAEL